MQKMKRHTPLPDKIFIKFLKASLSPAPKEMNIAVWSAKVATNAFARLIAFTADSTGIDPVN